MADKRVLTLLARLLLPLQFAGLGSIRGHRPGDPARRVLPKLLDLLAQKDNLVFEVGDRLPQCGVLCEEFIESRLRLIGHAYRFTGQPAKDSSKITRFWPIQQTIKRPDRSE